MAITRFEYEGLSDGWRLDPVDFCDCTLLVGFSGVGKSRTLQSLFRCSRSARSSTRGDAPHARWTVDVRTASGTITWSAQTDLVFRDLVGEGEEEDIGTDFVEERITAEDGSVLAERNGLRVKVAGREMDPAPNPAASLLSTFGREPKLAEIGSILRAVQGTQANRRSLAWRPGPRIQRSAEGIARDGAAERWAGIVRTLHERMESRHAGGADPDLDGVLQAFTDIFPNVQKFGFIRPDEDLDPPVREQDISVSETGVELPIPSSDLSSGMRRTLVLLAEVALLPPGSTLLVDEIEDSLGVNCLPEVLEALRRRRGEVQIILTSHHPAVVDSIPRNEWRVMIRKGSTVRAIPGSTIRALHTRSGQSAFRLLTNALERGIDP